MGNVPQSALPAVGAMPTEEFGLETHARLDERQAIGATATTDHQIA